MVADRGELDSEEAREFFARHGVRLTLTTTKMIVKELVKACNGNVKEWPLLVLYVVWANRTMHSSITGYMPAELMTGQALVMPTETEINTSEALPWKT